MAASLLFKLQDRVVLKFTRINKYWVLQVDVHIREPQPITLLHVPPMRDISGVLEEDQEKLGNKH